MNKILYLIIIAAGYAINDFWGYKKLSKKERYFTYFFLTTSTLFVILSKHISEEYFFLLILAYAISILILMCIRKKTKEKVISWLLNLFMAIFLMGLSFFFIPLGEKFIFFWLIFPSIYLVLWSGGLFSEWKTFRFWSYVLLSSSVYGLLILFDVNVMIILMWFLGCLVYPYLWASGLLDKFLKGKSS